MEKEAYLKARETAENELYDLIIEHRDLTEKLDSLDRRIGQLRETVVSLSHLCGDVPPKFPANLTEAAGKSGTGRFLLPGAGLTNAVRNVLQSYPNESLSASDVRDRLVRLGYDITKQTNILAAIHTILKRLVESDEAEADDDGGKTTYKYKRKTSVGKRKKSK